jgi:Domain of unknown function (DUF4123)
VRAQGRQVTQAASPLPGLDARDTAGRVARELPKGEPIYAVLDGARDRRIRSWVLDSRAPAWCLYRGQLPPALESAAPWLLRLLPGQPYTDRFFAVGWQNAWGILLASTAPSRELRRHLRKFFVVRTEDRKRLLFRYYDPRVLRAYLPTCTPDEATQFFGPISTMIAEGEEPGAFHVFRRSEKGLDHRHIEA